jgi:hypothetical protein
VRDLINSLVFSLSLDSAVILTAGSVPDGLIRAH